MDLKTLAESFTPFLIFGVVIALLIGLLFMFFSIALWGLLIGGLLWMASLIKQFFFPRQAPQKESSRIIDVDDHKS